MRRRALDFVVMLGGLLSCVSPVDQPGSRVPGKCSDEAPKIAAQKTDILFVIDNSGSMKEEQEGIARELPAFIEELKQGGGVAQDFQVGVITSTVYLFAEGFQWKEFSTQAGRLQGIPVLLPDGGTTSGPDKVLRGGDPAIVEKFRQLVQQGTAGSGEETPFEAVRLAVTGQLASTPLEQGGNQGFLRDGARLLVVVVSDEDDCSETGRPPKVSVGGLMSKDYCGEQAALLTPVSEYHRILTTELKDSLGAPRPVLWATIGPVATGTKQAQLFLDNGVVRNVNCPTSFGPGIRQREMAALFDQSLQNLDSICNPSYRESLIAIANYAILNQTIEVENVPDPRLLKVEVTRQGGEVQACTISNGGISYDTPRGDGPGFIHFEASCRRRASDKSVAMRMLCAG